MSFSLAEMRRSTICTTLASKSKSAGASLQILKQGVANFIHRGGIILATTGGADFAPNPLRTLTDHISPSKASFFLLFSRIRIILGFETQLTESGKRVKDNNE